MPQSAPEAGESVAMTDTATPKGLKSLKQYPAGFWWINAIELLERGAYYSFLSVFIAFMVFERGFPDGLVGVLVAVLQALLYFVPLISGAMAEKYGYRQTILVAFLFAASGYVFLAFTSGIAAVFVGLVIFGVGAGIFKPVAAASVSATTTPEQRNFGFTIYYMGINTGAFLFPLVVAILTDPSQVGLSLAPVLPTSAWNLVFFGSAALVTIAFMVTLLAFPNPRPPDPSKDVLGALKALGNVFRMPTFLALLVIYVGFWLMYAQYQFVAAVYMVDFGLFPRSFVPLYATINPLTIILAAPLVGKVIEKLPSLPVMMVGISTYLVGIAMIGIFRTPAMFIAGSVVLSLGELITHPGFLAYVTKLAPKDKTAVYLGYAFIPTGIGLVFGSQLGLSLYRSMAVDGGQPVLFWSGIVALGLLTVSLLLLYNLSRKWTGQIVAALLFGVGLFGLTKLAPGVLGIPTGNPVGDAGLVVQVVLLTVAVLFGAFLFRAVRREAAAAAPPTESTGRGRIARDVGIALVAILLVPLVIAGGIFAPTATSLRSGAGDDISATGSTAPGEAMAALLATDGSTNEGESTEATFNVTDDALAAVMVTLAWTDEGGSTPATENAPDTFKVSVKAPDGTITQSEETANDAGTAGEIALHVPLAAGAAAGEYTVTVTLVTAGDERPMAVGGLLGSTIPVSPQADGGNAWTLDVVPDDGAMEH